MAKGEEGTYKKFWIFDFRFSIALLMKIIKPDNL